MIAVVSAYDASMAPAPSFKSIPVGIPEGPSILFLAVAIIIARNASGASYKAGVRSESHAASPATKGEETLVPSARYRGIPYWSRTVIPTPEATTSGFSLSP